VLQTVTLLAVGNVIFCVDQVVDNRVGVGPQLEQVIAFEEGVVAVGRVRDDECLHRHRVFFHQIGDARIGVDDDFIGQTHLAAPIAFFSGQKMLAERPVPVIDGQAH